VLVLGGEIINSSISLFLLLHLCCSWHWLCAFTILSQKLRTYRK